MHSKDLAKGLKWQQKESIAQAVSVAPLHSVTQICCIHSITQICCNLHHYSPEKLMDQSYNRCLSHECCIGRLISCLFLGMRSRRLLQFYTHGADSWLHNNLLLAYCDNAKTSDLQKYFSDWLFHYLSWCWLCRRQDIHLFLKLMVFAYSIA